MNPTTHHRRRKDRGKLLIAELTTEVIDVFENLLPSALNDSQWCDANAREAFTKAKFVQESILQIPSTFAELIYSQISKSTKRSNLFPFLKDGSFYSFTNIGERLDIAFEINPTLTPELKEIIHVYFVQIFGEAAFERTKFYSILFLKYYKTNYGMITRESSPYHLMGLNANLQIVLAQGLERDRVIKNIKRSLGYRSSTFSDTPFLHTTVLFMLAHPQCDFINEIMRKLGKEIRIGEEECDQELVDLYFLHADIPLLRSALQNVENQGNPTFMELLIQLLNSFSFKATLQYSLTDPARVYTRKKNEEETGRDVNQKWVIPGSNFNFKQWKSLLQTATHGILRHGKNALEEQLKLTSSQTPNFNYDFWKDILRA